MWLPAPRESVAGKYRYRSLDTLLKAVDDTTAYRFLEKMARM